MATPRIAFHPVTDKTIEVFKVINIYSLPVRYAEKFYADLLKTPAEYTKLGVWRPLIVPPLATPPLTRGPSPHRSCVE